MNGVMEIASHPLIWLVAGICVAIVLWQAVIFFRKAWRTGLELGMDKSTMKEAVKAAAITCLGPSLSVGTGILALMVVLGPAMAWLRLSYVGALPYETLGTSLAVQGCGLEMGKDLFGGTEFATICFVLTTGAVGYTFVATFLVDKVGKAMDHYIGNNTKLLGVISAAALMSTIGGMATQHMMKIDANFAAVMTAVVVMAVLGTIGNKKNILWLKELSLFFSMVAGMIVGMLVAGLI